MTAAVLHEPPAWRRWSARLAWFVAGAIVHALLTASFDEDASPASNVIAHADHAPDAQLDASLPAQPSEPAPPDEHAPAAIRAEAISSSTSPPSIEANANAVAIADAPFDASADTDTNADADGDADVDANAGVDPNAETSTDPPANAPALPLPRMPGTRRLRSTATPAEDGRGWVLVHALQVPAKPEQVETFYRKALADQGMRITGGSTPAQPGRVFLRGRDHRAHADITIAGRGSRVRTSVQVIWRTFR